MLYRSPGDMIHTSPATHKMFQQDFDDFGDSYSEDTVPERLKDVFSKINVVRKIVLRNKIYILSSKRNENVKRGHNLNPYHSL